jgi:tetratricopeptide (TPR) repeat protein/glycosyltransferase involved in cell wall biosynthesis
MELVNNYQLAVECFKLKDFDRAQKILSGLLVENPADIDALNFLGMIMLNAGRYEEAISFFERAITIFEPHPITHYNLGLCLHHLKYTEKACAHYERAVELKPDYIDAINNRGAALIDLKQYAEAEKNFNTVLALQPYNGKAFNNRGNLFYNQDKLDLAEKDYQKAVMLEPGNPEFNFNLGNCYMQRKEFNEALKYFFKSVELDPTGTLAYNNIGLTLLKLHKLKEAEAFFKLALNNNPENAEVHYNLAGCYRELGEFNTANENLNSAIECYNKAVEIDPNLKGALINIGNIYKKLGKERESEQYFEKVSDDSNTKVTAFTNLGVQRMMLGKVDEALEYFNFAINVNNNITEPHYNKSHALLICGNFAEGWKEYEWRKKRQEFCHREFSKPELMPGMDVKDRRILVYDEQGLGDAIQFVRFIPLLIKHGANVILECSDSLSGLFNKIVGDSVIIKRDLIKEPAIEYDYQIALLSLPLFFGLTIENFNMDMPYIYADPVSTQKMSGLIGGGDDLKIGIVWGGNPNHTGDNKRSCKLIYFKSLLAVNGIKLFALQKGSPLQQVNEIDFPLVVLNDHLRTLMDTAGAIENLDLIITIDTSIAHLAGAMGKPVWLLLPFFPDWRWMLNRKDSPWYPSMKLFRQLEDENWELVFNEVLSELKKKKNMKHKKSNSQINLNPNLQAVDPASAALDSQYNSSVLLKQKGKLYLGLTGTGDFGWGVVNKYLKQEVSGKIEVRSLEENQFPPPEELNQAKIFQLIKDLDFNPLFEIKGKENFGYTVFENELNSNSVANSNKYDKVITASTWDYNKLVAAGITNAGLLIQGIDPKMFYPDGTKRNDNLFVIFSGGKFEIRKGQDLVLKAISILQKKYPDIILINAWYNSWVDSLRLMRYSKYIKYEEKGNTWDEFMNNIYCCNNIDPKKVFTLPLVPNRDLRKVYMKSDIGLFPNRCEGGTNLVMMEYMACGKPVIASFNSGHKDVLNENNSLMLKQMKEFKLFDSNTKLIADWEEPDIDEIIEKVEFAYNNRNFLSNVGNAAAETMKNFTWSATALNLLKIVGL